MGGDGCVCGSGRRDTQQPDCVIRGGGGKRGGGGGGDPVMNGGNSFGC